ncbi:MAG: hypothetical protein R3F62_25345 [Planctomycetota bacterium]
MSQPHAAHFASAEEQAHAVALGTWLFLAGEVLVFGALFLAVTVAQPAWTTLRGPVSASGHFTADPAGAPPPCCSPAAWPVALAARAARGPRPGAARPCGCRGRGPSGWFSSRSRGWNMRARRPGRPVARARVRRRGLRSPRAAQFFWLYLVLTGVHAVHVLVGVALLSLAAWAPAPQRVEGVGLFWHFVDLVWIYLLPALYLA